MIKAALFGSLMIALILLIRRLFGKKLPKFCFKFLWILTALRLILPFWFDIEVEVPKEPRTATSQSAVIYSAPTAGKADESVYEAVPEPEPADAVSILRVVHIVGALIIGGFMVSAYIRMRRLALCSKPVRTAHAGWARRVEVRSGESFQTPFSVGLLKPIIFIPTHMLTLEPSRFDAVMAHEISHIRSFDQTVKWLIVAAACLNWYNPLVWVMLRYAGRDIELACDEAVVGKAVTKADYAMTLIEAEEIRSASAVCSFGAPSLNERIEFIMKSKKTTMLGFAAAGAVLTLMTVFFINVNAVEAPMDEGEKLVSPLVSETGDDRAEAVEVTENEVIHHDLSDYAENAVLSDEYRDKYIDETTAVTEISNAEEDIYLDSEVEAEMIGEASVYVEGVSMQFECPLEEYGAVTGKFGNQTSMVGNQTFSNGVNVAAAQGAKVMAAADGKVIFADYNNECGNYVVVDHGYGFITRYCHLDSIDCEVGDILTVGDKLGEVGLTGKVTGPNLFFSLEIDGCFTDPIQLFQ